MADFLERQRTLDIYWRAVILFGRNVASYKFALAKSLIELSADGKSFVTLEELAIPFSKHIVEHLRSAPKQATSSSSRFLEACRKSSVGEINAEEWHQASYFDLSRSELNACDQLVQQARAEVLRIDEEVEGFNIGVNAGAAAGQTIQHCHLHLIPRCDGDVEDP